METQPHTPEGINQVSPQPTIPANPVQPGIPAAGGRVYKSTPEQRAAWNRQKERQRLGLTHGNRRPRPAVQSGGIHSTAPGPVPPVPITPAPGGEVPPVAAPVVSVPWRTSNLAPLFEQILPETEKWEIAPLKAKAEKISPLALAIVEKDAAWSPVTRTSILTAGPEVAAKWLNKWGIGAENAPEVILGGAILAIVFGHMNVSRKLDDLRKKMGATEPQTNGGPVVVERSDRRGILESSI